MFLKPFFLCHITPTGLNSWSNVKYLLRVSGITVSDTGAAFIGISRSGLSSLATLNIYKDKRTFSWAALIFTCYSFQDTCASGSNTLQTHLCDTKCHQENMETIGDHSTKQLTLELSHFEQLEINDTTYLHSRSVPSTCV